MGECGVRTWCSTSRNIVLGEKVAKLRKSSSRSISGREIDEFFLYFFFNAFRSERKGGRCCGRPFIDLYSTLSPPPPFPSPSFRILRFALRETDTCLMHEFHSCRQFTSSLEPRVPNSTSRSAKLNSPVRGNVRRVRKVQFLPS